MAAILLVLAQLPASAQSCSFSNSGINFGNVDLTSGGFQSATGTFTADCTGTPGRTIEICANFNEGSGGSDSNGSPRFLGQGTTQMRYDLFRSNGVGQVWGSYTWPYSPRPPSITVNLNGSGFGSVSRTIFARLYNQQSTLPPGTFQSVFSGAQTQIDYGYSNGFSCGSSLSSRMQNVPFTVRMTNNSTCVVTASDLNFGTHFDLSSPVTATNEIAVTCTAGTQFELGLSGGISGSNDPTQRLMGSLTNSEGITYGIYRDPSHSQPWGTSFGSTINAVGTGLSQSFTGYGLVIPQATPSSQEYVDSVIVTLTY